MPVSCGLKISICLRKSVAHPESAAVMAEKMYASWAHQSKHGPNILKTEQRSGIGKLIRFKAFKARMMRTQSLRRCVSWQIKRGRIWHQCLKALHRITALNLAH